MRYTDNYLQDLRDIQKSIPCLEKLRNKRIMVTGGGGLIGSALVDFLLSLNDNEQYGIEVYVAARNKQKIEKRFSASVRRKDFIYVPYEAAEPVSLKHGVDYIVHAASPANPAAYSRQPVETMAANFQGMYHILNYARDFQVTRVVYVSSSEVYGKKNDGKPYHEDEYGFLDILNPRACYPSSKRAAETLCASFLQEYNVDSVIVRPGHVYGGTALPEDNRAATQFMYDVINDRDIVMKSPGLQLRSYCYVCDAVSSVFVVMLNGEKGRSYNISNPDSICTIRELAECIARTGGKTVEFAVPSEAETRSYNLMDNSSLDSTLIESLGWKGMFDLSTGVAHSLEALK